ncbi:MAG TPA: phosphopantothenate/pantothenate synthetase [Candidatus Lokiarchaeia archaeon]|nr:phosphopantothenate/pantothenate synthetase [Candidatus Lokiarchaeia archaeon]
MADEIPADHPRAEALRIRHRLTDAVDTLIVAKAGLLAHGRGEAFDYLFGEKTPAPAEDAMRVAVAMLLSAQHPVISANGNTVALDSKVLVDLARAVGAKLEVNIFYTAPGRIEAIRSELESAGAEEILGLGDVEPETIPELSSNRRVVDPRGIFIADVVLVPLEDGDRTEALRKMGKSVVAIDLNPLSRTAQMANVTIVDNFLRCMPRMIELVGEMREWSSDQLQELIASFNNAENLRASMQVMIDHLTELAQQGVFMSL